MEILPNNIYLKFNENTLQEVRKLFNLDKPGLMENCINILEEWVKMQPHFMKKDFERKYLETTIIVSKGSIEKAKSRLNRGCTLRTLTPHLFGLHDIRHMYNTVLKDVKDAVLPKMTKNYSRVYILKAAIKKSDGYIMPSLARALTYKGEYLRRNDYVKNNCVIIDYTDSNMTEIVKESANSALYDNVVYLMDCCGFRVEAIYLISTSKIVEALVSILKQATGGKLRDRFHVIKDRKSLTNILDKDILPVEYGGFEKSIEELHEDFIDAFTSDEHIEYMKQMNSARTDETRRQSAKFNEEYLGMPGSFRKLYVD